MYRRAHFKTRVSKVIANNWKYYSYVLNRNYIGNCYELANKADYIEILNSLSGTENGLIYSQYCRGGGVMTVSISPMTTIKNRCHQIDYRALAETGEISDDLYYFRLCCLLENAAKCANTASVYGAFFKHLKQSAQKTLVIAPADYQINNGEHEVYNEDANSLIKRIEGDILYLDPPYNSRQYSANYHLLNTIADYKSFTPKGKTELREYNKSNYCSKAKVQHTFKDLIRNARSRYIVLSYNNEGIMPMQTIEQIMTKYGNYQMFQKEHQRFKADKTENKNHLADTTTEYLQAKQNPQ